jgi:major type 1 subunit fimbrin (pilin)
MKIYDKKRKRRKTGTRLMAMLLMFGFLLISSDAFAAYWCNSPQKREFTIGFPSSVVVPRDAPVGTRLTGWIRAPGAAPRFWTCGSSGGATTTGWSYISYSLTSYAGIDVDGFRVYKTTVPGIGIAVKAWGIQQQDYSPYTIVNPWRAASLGVGDTGWGYWSSASQSLGYAIGGAVDAMLVKIGTVTPGVINRNLAFAQYPRGTGDEHYGGGGYDTNYYVPQITITTASCTTPDISVALGDHTENELASIGSQTTPVKFNATIKDCPAGLTGVDYRFNFQGGTGFTAGQGLFGLLSSATAKGVQVKLMKDDGTTVVELDKWYPLSSYNKTLGGTYTVPLSAAYQRTGSIQAGSADTELIMMMQYK